MNLLKDAWIPIQNTGVQEKITLQNLLCGEKKGELCLPRDDMELAALQLLAALTQACFTPSDRKALMMRIKTPLSEKEFLEGIKGKEDWFDMNHPETPFMQFRRGKSKECQPLSKLLPSVQDGRNKAFVNPAGISEKLCQGCSAIVLFNAVNLASTPGGRGYKTGLRGQAPLALVLYWPDMESEDALRRSLWLNIIHQETVRKYYDFDNSDDLLHISGVSEGSKYFASKIGLNKGLFWTPVAIELMNVQDGAQCSMCGVTGACYQGFRKNPLSFSVKGVWVHPSSPIFFDIKKGDKELKYPSYNNQAMPWTQLTQLIYEYTGNKRKYISPLVVKQLNDFSARKKIPFIMAGYSNDQAMITGRCHTLYNLSDDWFKKPSSIFIIVENGMSVLKILKKSLNIFKKGGRFCGEQISGIGIDLIKEAEMNFYSKTDALIIEAVSTVDVHNPSLVVEKLQSQLCTTALGIFNQVTEPYRQEPKMLKALALARRSLNKSLADLTPNTSQET